VRLQNPICEHRETRSDRRFVGFQLWEFVPNVLPIDFVESQVGDGVLSCKRVRCPMQVEKLAAHEVAFRLVAATCLAALSLAAIP
jgi:hypothetical protein